MDFTVKSYKKLLVALKDFGFGFLPYNVFHLQNDQDKKFICLRHDVDARKENSLEFAKIQHQMGIAGTYYFRTIPQSYDEKVILEMANLGHEIGYHYETMDTARGHVDNAYDEFVKNLEMFRKIVPITTICMHGSPLSKFDNRDIWKKYDYKKLGLIAEPYFDVDFNKTFYLTDTGRRWDGAKVSVRDKAMDANACSNPDFLSRSYHSTFDIISDLEKKDFPGNVMMTFHPQRWTDDKLLWYKEFFAQNLKNQIKRILIK
ncbi:MAG: hypothetical protein JNJ41_00615 [Bacteroidia bacterium]|nr:hypothetical protein [Bacteroidia bacterium]